MYEEVGLCRTWVVCLGCASIDCYRSPGLRRHPEDTASGARVSRLGTIGVFPEKHEELRDAYVLDDHDDAVVYQVLMDEGEHGGLKDVLPVVDESGDCRFDPCGGHRTRGT